MQSASQHTDPIVLQMVVSWLVANSIELLKKSRLAWIGQHSVVLNKALSASAAAATSVGITFGFTGDIFAGGSISIAFPGLTTMLTLAINGIFGMMLQEVMYQKAVRDPKPEAVTMAGTVTAPSGRPVGHVEMVGVSAEAGSEAARAAASVIDGK